MKSNLISDENIFNQLNNSHIVSVNIGDNLNTIISFYVEIGDKEIILELQDICLIKISKFLEDKDGSYPVFEFKFQPITDGGKSIFEKLGYSYFTMDNKMFSYPDSQLYYLSIEGDICMDIVAGGYKIKEKLNK